MLSSEEIHKRPGLSIQVAVVAATKARVANQALEPKWALDTPPVGKSQVVGTADSRPPAAADHLELRGKPFLQPDRKQIVPRYQAAVRRQLMDHFMSRRAQVHRPPIEIQKHRLARDFIADPREERSGLITADRPRRLVGELDLDPASRWRVVDHLAIPLQLVTPGRRA